MLKKSKKKKKTKTSTNIVNKDNCRPGASVKDLISDPWTRGGGLVRENYVSTLPCGKQETPPGRCLYRSKYESWCFNDKILFDRTSFLLAIVLSELSKDLDLLPMMRSCCWELFRAQSTLLQPLRLYVASCQPDLVETFLRDRARVLVIHVSSFKLCERISMDATPRFNLLHWDSITCCCVEPSVLQPQTGQTSVPRWSVIELCVYK